MTALTPTDQLVDQFLAQRKEQAPLRKRLIFVIDATASRQPTWDAAAKVHGQMFIEAGRYGGLDVQLVYFRGYDEMKATRFFGSTVPLVQAMSGVICRSGPTQLARALRHILKEHEKAPVAAAILIGDFCEEILSDLHDPAIALGKAKVPVYCFLEGDLPEGRDAFSLIAESSGGALIPFDGNSPNQLRELLGAVAAYVAGGLDALTDHKPEVVRLLTRRNPWS
jgi:hypothetical protein